MNPHFLKYRSKAISDDYETQANKNCKLKLPTPAYTGRKISVHIDHEFLLMIRKHNITKVAG